MTEEEQFYRLLAQRQPPTAFEHNWPYIVQATRNGLDMYRAHGAHVYCTRRTTSNHSMMVIVHALGARHLDALRELAERERVFGRRILVKNIAREDVDVWRSAGFEETTEPWSRYSYRDDNTFPQYITARDTVLYAAYRKDLAKTIRRFSVRTITTEPFDTRKDVDARRLLDAFALYAARKGFETTDEVVRAHEFFFDSSIKQKIRLQHIENGRLIGWSFLTPVRDTLFHNAVICDNESNLMKHLVHEGLVWVFRHHPHIQHFVDQGSENAGQDWTKQRINPLRAIHKTHMVSAL